ncbi:M48 family metallopeptidase [Parendozoicomonas haliclonae]|uniref:YgjP-like metallopeptidase domain-containing protein n=1 Tax=Parendozoicomonas haliclonae TaxID=1960125 RepID=A0A1X7ALK1_9GAMM|nr:M48 family metallopeptidase [Parendozoicomonas haliclonae]SMA48265.1 hypothetical protein EHSB41UT_02672 [Parendozoicomonas haliclonae]
MKYLQGYPEQLVSQAQNLLDNNRLKPYLLKKYPQAHAVRSNEALYKYTQALKSRYLKQSQPITKVVYDDKINVMKHALGMHVTTSRIQGNKLKAKKEIRIASVFKLAPEEFLKMIVVHELAHLREKDHNKAFYQLCNYMEPDYHQLELDLRLYLTLLDTGETLY